MKTIFRQFKVAAPWLIAAAIFVYLFHLYPPLSVLQALTHVNLLPFLLFSAAYFVALYLLDAWAARYVLARFTRSLPFSEILTARGATYPIMILSYPASQAAFAYYFKRRHGIPIFEVLSAFIFIMFIDMWWVATLALAGSFFQERLVAGIDLSRIVFKAVIAMYALYALWFAFWRRLPSERFWRAVTPAFVERQRHRKIFHLFEHARCADYLRVGAMRLPVHLFIIVSMYVLIRLFNCDIPFTQVLGNIPLIFFIGALPITPGGIGTTNALMVELLKDHVSGAVFHSGALTPAALLFSASLAWMFANFFFKIAVGTVLMNRASKKLFRAAPETATEEIEHDAAHLGGNL